MIKEAEAHADEAHKLRELADARNQAETLAYQTEQSLKEHRDKLDEADASTIEGRIMELRGVLESSDVDEIRAKTDALQEACDGSSPRRSTRRRRPQATSARRRRRRVDAGRRGDRGRRLRGRRRGGGGRPRERRAAIETRADEVAAEPSRTPEVDELAAADARARRVPRRAPAAEGRVRQLPQAGRARPGATWSRAPASGS